MSVFFAAEAHMLITAALEIALSLIKPIVVLVSQRGVAYLWRCSIHCLWVKSLQHMGNQGRNRWHETSWGSESSKELGWQILVVDEAGIVEPPVNTTTIQNLPTIYSVISWPIPNHEKSGGPWHMAKVCEQVSSFWLYFDGCHKQIALHSNPNVGHRGSVLCDRVDHACFREGTIHLHKLQLIMSCNQRGRQDSDRTPTHCVPLVAPDDGVVVTIGSPDPPATPFGNMVNGAVPPPDAPN